MKPWVNKVIREKYRRYERSLNHTGRSYGTYVSYLTTTRHCASLVPG
ncbi:MAG: hypothetical protein LUH22_03655 [Bacteroides sp.]|nr:hypothetical protein [Bacteroides sp.]